MGDRENEGDGVPGGQGDWGNVKPITHHPSPITPAETWVAVERYFSDVLELSDSVLEATLAASADAGLPAINVSPTQGKLLHVLARAVGARAILEIGTLGGYSAIWLARALPPDGRLVTLEADPAHATVARTNIARAGLEGVVDVRLGKALETLPRLESEGLGPFDVFFIDADKPNNTTYFDWAVRLSRPGSLIVVDNVVRDGKVLDAESDDATVQAVRRLNEHIAAEPRVSATAMQTVGSKGYDGFILALVTAGA
jgi:predicted O-methyltransferase YrrM